MNDPSVSRRDFLRAGAAATAMAAAAPAVTASDDKPGKDTPAPVPTRKLGRTGLEVSILNQGTAFKINGRHLNIMDSEGVRYIDAADCYGGGAAERAVGDWLDHNGRRKEYFVVTKDHPTTPGAWVEMVDKRLEALKSDYIDLFFIHQLGQPEYGGEACAGWPADKDWAAAADKLRKSGKAKAVGFSTHAQPIELRTELLNNAAKGGWVDAIMVATDPTLIREDNAFNKALDACHKAGIGLISMKENRGGLTGIKDIFPSFKEKGLTPYTAVLSAIWTDERFCSICSHMDNVKKLRENAEAARNFKPLTGEELAAVDDMLRRHNRSFCVACDGSCRRAGGTQADLNTIARYVAYVEESGQLKEARKLFAALPAEARDWSGADLQAASHACRSHLDFARILAKAEQLLA